MNAIEALFAESLRVRCWFHKMGNLRSKLPPEGAEEFLAHARTVRDAATHEAGELQATALIERFEGLYPEAPRCFSEDLEASLAHLSRFPFATG